MTKQTISEELAEKSRALVYATAKKYEIPPVYITAHITTKKANQARYEVWRIMINEWKLKRYLVAAMFRRDLRRVRASVIDRKIKPKPAIPYVLIGSQYFWDFSL